jgi:hypothetical protein
MESDENNVPVCRNVEEGLKHNVTSTGRQLGVVPAQTHGMFKVKYIDGRTGALPESLQGKYTGVKFAQHDISDFIRKTWALAEENTPTAVKKKQKAKQEDEQLNAA